MIGILMLFFVIFNLLAGHILPSVPLLVVMLIALSPTRHTLEAAINWRSPGWLSVLVAVALVVIYVIVLFRSVLMTDDVFKSEYVRTAMMAIYDEKLEQWPTSYKTRVVKTSIGLPPSDASLWESISGHHGYSLWERQMIQCRANA